MQRAPFSHLLVAAALLSTACSGDDAAVAEGVDAVEAMETTAPAEVVAGDTVDITCAGVDRKGNPVTVDGFSVNTSPEEGTEATGLSVRFTKAGDVEVACVLNANGLADDTPAIVRVVPAAAARIVAEVQPGTTKAGEAAAVRCLIADEFGNEIDSADDLQLTVVAEPDEGVTASADSVTGTVAGDYEVFCRLAKGNAPDNEGAPWTVVPGPPATMALAYDPEEKAYDVEQPITVRGVGVDDHGNEITGIALTDITVDPGDNHRLVGENDDILRFDAEGVFEVSAVAAEHPDLRASRPLVVDQSPPVVALTSPDRGLTLQEETTVTFAGTVEDNLGEVAWLEIAGERITLPAEGGPFEVTRTLGYGANLTAIRASDPYDNVRELGRGPMWSSGWHELSPPAMETDGIGSAIQIILDQDAIDDGDHDPTKNDDLATIVEQVLANIDLSELIPDPLTEFDFITTYQIRMTSFSYDAPRVNITLLPQALRFEVVMPNLQADIELRPDCNIPVVCNPLPGRMQADPLRFVTTIELSVVNGAPQASAKDTEVEFKDLDISIPNAPLGLINALLDTIAPTLGDVLGPLMAGLVEDQVGELIGGLFEALTLDLPLEIPALVEGGTPNTIRLQANPVAINITPEYLRIALDGMAASDTPVRPYEVLGSLGFQGCGPAGQPPVPPPSRFLAGIHDDLINQLLFGLWDGGTLTLNLGPEETAGFDLPAGIIKDLSISTDFLLPLSLNSCGGAGGELTIHLADAYLEADLKLLGKDSRFGFWMNGQIALKLISRENDAGETELAVEVGDIDPLILEVVINEGQFEGDDAGLVELVRGTLLPQLLGPLTEDLAFAIPTIDLAETGAGFPEGTVIALDLQGFDRNGAFMMVKAALK